MYRFPSLVLIGVLLLAAAGCSREPSPDAAGTAVQGGEPAPSDTVEWFQGGVEAAFAHAAATNKPLFLYWGAEWCPYCKLLEANIFIREEFVRMSRQFVAVDMSNGDSTTIHLADEFKIYGLPTVIVFSPDGRELTRIPGGMDMEQYAGVLALTLNQVRPVADLVSAALAGEALSAQDWQLLANYSWTQDRGQALGEEHPEAVLLRLREAVPPADRSTWARLGLEALAVWSRQAEEARDAALAETHLAQAEAVLADPELSAENLMLLAALGGDIVALAEGDRQAALQRELAALMRPAVEDTERNLLNRASILSGWAGVVTGTLEDDAALPAPVLAWGRGQADAMVPALDAFQVHAGINSLWGVYYDLGFVDEARATLQVGIDRSKAPYYFMSGMAYVEREAGNDAAALDWYRRAWEATSNPLDRARWGSRYLQQVMKMTPDDAGEVERAGTALLADLLSQANGLTAYERTLARIGESLAQWSDGVEQRNAVVAGLQRQVDQSCGTLVDGEASPAVCGQFAALGA